VTHFLQLLRIIGAEKLDLKKSRKREQADHNKPTIFDPGLNLEEVKESFQNDPNEKNTANSNEFIEEIFDDGESDSTFEED
jgi:hypothetical protein